MKLFFWAFRELRNQKKWSLFFILNLSVGLSGFIALDAFKTSLQKNFRDNAKVNMSGDLSLGTRRLFNEDELKKINEFVSEQSSIVSTSRNWELFSMAYVKKEQGAGESRLIRLVAVDAQFPLYGQVKIEKAGQLQAGQSSELTESRSAWVYPEVLMQLGLKEGEEISVGGEAFKIVGVVREDPTQGLRFSSLSPKVYVGLEQIRKTRLIGYGTTMFDEFLFKTKDEQELTRLKAEIEKKFPDPALRVETYLEDAEDSGGALKYLSDYLGLVALVALFLAGLGSVFLFRSFLLSRYYSIAIQNALGMQLKLAVRVYLVQLLMLGVGASLISILGAQIILPFLSRILAELTPMNLSETLPQSTVLLALLMGTFGSVFIGYPFLRPIYRIKAQELLQETNEIRSQTNKSDFLWLIPIWILFWLLAVIQSNSWRVGSLFFVIFLSSLIFLWGIGFGFLKSIPLQGFSKMLPWYYRQALLSIQRRSVAKVSLIVAIGLGSILINLLPQLEVGLRENIASPEKSQVPSIFMFDIQQEQLEPLVEKVKTLGHEVSNISPMVRARIKKINEQDYERTDVSEVQTREDEREARFRNRGVNLSYRESLTNAESVVEGDPFPGRYDAGSGLIPQISVEKRFAETMNIKLKDIVTFDVQGIEIQGVVTSFRKVKWNSFQPNFFVQFQAGVLEEAPQTLLASISKLDKNKVVEVQGQLSQQFPNVSMIDVGRLIDKIIEISQKMSWSLEIMAYLSILAGLVILYSLASVEVRNRSWDLNMLKVLGSGPKNLYIYLMVEFGSVVFVGALLGTLLSFFVSYSISFYMFEGIYVADFLVPLRNILIIVTLSILITYLAAKKVIMTPSKEIFLNHY
jgi:putative ABC transport system permease protein